MRIYHYNLPADSRGTSRIKLIKPGLLPIPFVQAARERPLSVLVHFFFGQGVFFDRQMKPINGARDIFGKDFSAEHYRHFQDKIRETVVSLKALVVFVNEGNRTALPWLASCFKGQALCIHTRRTDTDLANDESPDPYENLGKTFNRSGITGLELFGELACIIDKGKEKVRAGCVDAVARSLAPYIKTKIIDELTFPGYDPKFMATADDRSKLGQSPPEELEPVSSLAGTARRCLDRRTAQEESHGLGSRWKSRGEY